MKKLKILWIIACVGLVFAPAAVIGAQPGPPGGLDVSVTTVYRFAGYSNDSTDGYTGGPWGMHTICQDTFGPAARMCTMEEFWRTPAKETTDPPVLAWIQPSPVAAYFDSTISEWRCVDHTGFTYRCTNACTTCFRWTLRDDFVSGTVVVARGGEFGISKCDTVLRVTCCLPTSQLP
jgi:hypothetical protein